MVQILWACTPIDESHLAAPLERLGPRKDYGLGVV